MSSSTAWPGHGDLSWHNAEIVFSFIGAVIALPPRTKGGAELAGLDVGIELDVHRALTVSVVPESCLARDPPRSLGGPSKRANLRLAACQNSEAYVGVAVATSLDGSLLTVSCFGGSRGLALVLGSAFLARRRSWGGRRLREAAAIAPDGLSLSEIAAGMLGKASQPGSSNGAHPQTDISMASCSSSLYGLRVNPPRQTTT